MSEIQAEDLVLVAVVTSPLDLEIARVLGWYRIPLATAPKTVRADWLAFYQTGAFERDKWVVRYVCRIQGHELVTRRELLFQQDEHARAEEPYFKLQLGGLQELTRPIPAKRWRRITFLFTTGDRLLRASDVRELTLPPGQEQDRLWRIIRERESD